MEAKLKLVYEKFIYSLWGKSTSRISKIETLMREVAIWH